jgi:murein hydrolase activator
MFLLLCLCVAGNTAFAQSKKELEERRTRLLKEIASTDKMLRQTTKTKTNTFDRFVAQQRKVERRERLIQNLGNEIVASEDSVALAETNITALTADIANLRAEYARMARSAFRQKTMTNPIMFILSAESLNQAFRRWLLLLKYNRYRQGQAQAIQYKQQLLRERIATIERNRTEKEKLLSSISNQQTTLEQDLTEKNALLQTLTQDEARLQQELAQKQAAYENLNKAIERIIRDEVAKQAAVPKKKSKTKPPAPAPAPPTIVETPKPTATEPKPNKPIGPEPEAPPADEVEAAEDEDETSVGFNRQQGRLPWPVENGFVSRTFGRQKHPTIRNIEITNNGIDIRTEPGEPARAVFDGEVTGVQFIPGHNYTVIVRHGNYYTVYSNLEGTNLSKGDMVKKNQTLGAVSNNPITGAAELHFEVWHQKERLNPSRWIED